MIFFFKSSFLGNSFFHKLFLNNLIKVSSWPIQRFLSSQRHLYEIIIVRFNIK